MPEFRLHAEDILVNYVYPCALSIAPESRFFQNVTNTSKPSGQRSTLDNMFFCSFTHSFIQQLVIKHLLKMSLWAKAEVVPPVTELTA